jgi:hypothetical protein
VSRYLTRVSALLREGRPVHDVALYLPTHDGFGDIKNGTAHLLELLRERIGPVVPAAILDAGFGFDVIDDGLLAEPATIEGNELVVGAQRFRVVVLPAVRTMPAETLARLRAFQAAGGKIIATDRLPERTPGLRGEPLPADLKIAATPAASLGAALRAALTPDIQLEPESPDVGQHHRRIGDADVYFLANTANRPHTSQLTVRALGRAEWWDPLTGATRAAEPIRVSADAMTVALDLDAYGSAVLVVARGPAPRVTRSAPRPRPVPPPQTLAGPWTVSFADPQVAPRTLATPASWDADDATRFYSGVATYETTFEMGPMPPGFAIALDFGEGHPIEANDRGPGMRTWLDAPIRDAAVITVNGQRAGSVWSPPYRLDIGAFVRPGKNTLAIRVGNTPLNHMAGRPLPDYRLLVLRYGDRFQPQGMELIRPLPSGLVGPVRLVTRPRSR